MFRFYFFCCKVSSSFLFYFIIDCSISSVCFFLFAPVHLFSSLSFLHSFVSAFPHLSSRLTLNVWFFSTVYRLPGCHTSITGFSVTLPHFPLDFLIFIGLHFLTSCWSCYQAQLTMEGSEYLQQITLESCMSGFLISLKFARQVPEDMADAFITVSNVWHISVA